MENTEINAIPTEVQTFINDYMAKGRKNRWKALRDLNRYAMHGGIVFAGDSIIEGFPVHELIQSCLPLYNRGVGSATSKDLLDNLEVFTDLAPRKVFLLIGTNDLADNTAAAEISGRIKDICKGLLEKKSSVNIYIISVLPINMSGEINLLNPQKSNDLIQILNKKIADIIIDIPNAAYLDCYTELLNKRGELHEDYTTDGLHLNITGYRKIAKTLSFHINAQCE